MTRQFKTKFQEKAAGYCESQWQGVENTIDYFLIIWEGLLKTKEWLGLSNVIKITSDSG